MNIKGLYFGSLTRKSGLIGHKIKCYRKWPRSAENSQVLKSQEPISFKDGEVPYALFDVVWSYALALREMQTEKDCSSTNV